MSCTIETVTARPAVFDFDQMAPENAEESQNKAKKSVTCSRRRPRNPIPIVFSDSLHDGACFTGDEHFRKVFNAHCADTGARFRVASAERTVGTGDEISARFEYKFVKFQCPRAGKPRNRGTGKRTCKSYLPSDCPAQFRLTFHDEDYCYKISKCCLSHNHALDDTAYSRKPAPRTPKLKAQVQQRYLSTTPVSSKRAAKRGTPSDTDESRPSSSSSELPSSPVMPSSSSISSSSPTPNLPELIETQTHLNMTASCPRFLQNLNFQPAPVVLNTFNGLIKAPTVGQIFPQLELGVKPAVSTTCNTRQPQPQLDEPTIQSVDKENNPNVAAFTNLFSAILTFNAMNPTAPPLPLPTMEQFLQIYMNSFRSGL